MDSIPTAPSPPSGPMTRARVIALHDKVNSVLSSFDFDSTLDGMLLHADTLCILRYEPPKPREDGASRASKEGREDQASSPGAVLPASSPVLPASVHSAPTLLLSRVTGTTGSLQPVLLGTGTTDATTGSLPVRSCQTRSIADIATPSTPVLPPGIYR